MAKTEDKPKEKVKGTASKGALTAYDVVAKQRDVPFVDFPVINKTGNRYLAQGLNINGNKMARIMGEESALEAIKRKIATKGAGWKD